MSAGVAEKHKNYPEAARRKYDRNEKYLRRRADTGIGGAGAGEEAAGNVYRVD